MPDDMPPDYDAFNVEEGRVTLVTGAWIGPDHAREPVEDVETALRDWATWVPQENKPVVWMADS